MFIDNETVRNMELVQNALSLKTVNTLYGMSKAGRAEAGLLNTCFTPMGSRTLRHNIIQPPLDQDLINNRLDVVQGVSVQGVADENSLAIPPNLQTSADA
jgi:DNA mismatch repair ATPase MutS